MIQLFSRDLNRASKLYKTVRSYRLYPQKKIKGRMHEERSSDGSNN
jgi:hypothetical protein